MYIYTNVIEDQINKVEIFYKKKHQAQTKHTIYNVQYAICNIQASKAMTYLCRNGSRRCRNMVRNELLTNIK